MNSKITLSRWNHLCHSVAISADQQEFQRLYTAYSEAHRTYHSVQHLEECIQHLDHYKQLHSAINYTWVEIALWYHDAIYQPKAKARDNERKSAQWAMNFLKGSGAKAIVHEQVYALIMATCHAGYNGEGNMSYQLIIDIDLAILGAESKRFAEYEQQVRAEYQWVPRFIYNKKRGQILQSFLAAESIYQTSWFYTNFERRARENILKSICSLSV